MYDLSRLEGVLGKLVLQVSELSETNATLSATKPLFSSESYKFPITREKVSSELGVFQKTKRETNTELLSNAEEKLKVSQRTLVSQRDYFNSLGAYNPNADLWIGHDVAVFVAFERACLSSLETAKGQSSVDLAIAARIEGSFNEVRKGTLSKSPVQTLGYTSEASKDLTQENLLEEIYSQRLKMADLSLEGLSLTCRYVMIHHDAAVFLGQAIRLGFVNRNDENLMRDSLNYIDDQLLASQQALGIAVKGVERLQSFILDGLVGMYDAQKGSIEVSRLKYTHAGLDLVL